MNKKEDNNWFNARDKIRVQCRCSHSLYIPHQVAVVVCNWCGRKVYKDPKREFKDKLLLKMKEGKK